MAQRNDLHARQTNDEFQARFPKLLAIVNINNYRLSDGNRNKNWNKYKTSKYAFFTNHVVNQDLQYIKLTSAREVSSNRGT